MAVSVEVPQIFRKHTNGSKVIRVEAATIRELFQRLRDDYPGLRKELMTDDGQLHRFVNVYLNEEDIRYLRSLETPLKDGDRLAILPAVAGGRPSGGLPAVAGGRPSGGLPAVAGGRPSGGLVLRFPTTLTLILAPSPWTGEGTQGVPGEGGIRVTPPTVPLTLPSPTQGRGEPKVGGKDNTRAYF